MPHQNLPCGAVASRDVLTNLQGNYAISIIAKPLAEAAVRRGTNWPLQVGNLPPNQSRHVPSTVEVGRASCRLAIVRS